MAPTTLKSTAFLPCLPSDRILGAPCLQGRSSQRARSMCAATKIQLHEVSAQSAFLRLDTTVGHARGVCLRGLFVSPR